MLDDEQDRLPLIATAGAELFLHSLIFTHVKILHTADWHIGKTLYKQSMTEEINLFFKWLLQTVDDHDIDILLVSGDIFDLANPSNADKTLYYQILGQLKERNVTCVITAGNHDSPSLLEGPKPLMLPHIHVIGYGSPLERQLLTLSNRVGNEFLHVIATPFLREGDIRKAQAGSSYDDKVKALRAGITSHYKQISDMARAANPDLPTIAMGHLYVQGASLSDSERDIHIGNQAGLSVDKLNQLFDYMALGHIHRPQKLNKEGTIRYSGSPIPLSFSERKDEKQVILIDVSGAKISDITSLKIPIFRPLVRMEGSLDEVKEMLLKYRSSGVLPALIEIIIKELERDQTKVLDTIALSEIVSPHYLIINYRIKFDREIESLIDKGLHTGIEDLTPREVFEKRIEQEVMSDEVKKELLEAFEEVYELTTAVE